MINPPNRFGDGMIRYEFFGDEDKQDKDKAFEHASSRSSGQENSPAAVNQDKRRTGSLCFLPHSFLGFPRFLITSHLLHSWCSLLCQLFSILPLSPFPGSFPYFPSYNNFRLPSMLLLGYDEDPIFLLPDTSSPFLRWAVLG